MSLSSYGYIEETYMSVKTYNVSVSSKDKIIQVMDGNVLLASLSMTLTNNKLSLIGKNDLTIAEIDLPESKIISDAYYDAEKKDIVLVVSMADGSTTELVVDVDDLLVIYEAGDGIDITNNIINVKINSGSTEYLSVDKDGLAFDMSKLNDTYATDEDLKSYATKEEVDELSKSFDSKLEDKANKSEIPSLENYVTKDELNVKVDKTELDNKADKSEIPSLDGYATEEWVSNQGFLKQEQDISGLATKAEVFEVKELVDNKVDWVDISTSAYPNRKAILLGNHEPILGTATEEYNKATVPLIMLNKWNIVDIGTPKTVTNINTLNGFRPTVQEYGQTGEEAHQIAYLSDVTNLSDSVDGKLSEKANKEEIPSLDGYAKKEEMPSLDGYATEEWVNNQGFLKQEQDISGKVDWVKTNNDPSKPNRKSIVLENHDILLGKGSDGGSYNLAMVSKWDVADYGSTALHLNLNSKNKVTVNDEHTLAYMSDITDVENKIINIYMTKEDGSELESLINSKADKSYVDSELDKKATKDDLKHKQDKLVPGLGISIEDNVVTCTLDTNLFIIPENFSLPSIGETNKIYLIPNLDGVENNSITEYYYTGNHWEKIGEYKASVDLSEYIKQGDLKPLVNDIINSILVDYATKSDVVDECTKQVANGIIESVRQSQIYTNNSINDLRDETIAYVDTKIDDYSIKLENTSERLVLVENKCNHYDDLFKTITLEHGGIQHLNVYTKEEVDGLVNSLLGKIKELEDKISQIEKV